MPFCGGLSNLDKKYECKYMHPEMESKSFALDMKMNRWARDGDN